MNSVVVVIIIIIIICTIIDGLIVHLSEGKKNRKKESYFCFAAIDRCLHEKGLCERRGWLVLEKKKLFSFFFRFAYDTILKKEEL